MPAAHPPIAPATSTATLEGVVERVIFRNAETGYTVIRLSAIDGTAPVLIGTLPPLSQGETVRARGLWEVDAAWGQRLKVERIDILAEDEEAALAHYLASGVVPGLGERLAARLTAHFGRSLAHVLADEPGRLVEVQGIGSKLGARIAEYWRGARRERDLMLFLHAHGLGAVRAKAILEAYGDRAVQTIAQDPYALAREVRGIGFHTADEIAQRIGMGVDAPERCVAALEHVLRMAGEEGHCAMPLERLLSAAAEILAKAPSDLEAAFAAACSSGILESFPASAGSVLVQTRAIAKAEQAVATRIAQLAAAATPWRQLEETAALERAEAALGLEFDPSQRATILALLARPLAIVTGGPGTGKTTLVRAILAALEPAGLSIALVAPTGRAARRLAESTGRETRTIHRLLEADRARGFRRNRSRPLEVDYVICDEASMVDIQLMAGLLAAMPDRAGLLLVGDVDQLPSVGPGQVLADLIAAGTASVSRLSRIFRQSEGSGIVANAHRINAGAMPTWSHEGDVAEGALFGVRADDEEAAIERIVELVAERIPERFGLDPLTDIQVLVPTNRGGVGTRSLNEALAAKLNPSPERSLMRGERRFALGDKVMQTENDHDREVSNGDIGRIIRIDLTARSLVVALDGRELTYAGGELDALVPAYAVTVHKAQGSEYPAIVLALMRHHGRMLRRRLFYTAITRAKRVAVVVAEHDAVGRAVRDLGERPRLTLLARRLASSISVPSANDHAGERPDTQSEPEQPE